MADVKTIDPDVVIEEQSSGYVRYRDIKTRRRWEVRGTCDRRGDCLIGAVIDTSDGPVEVMSHAHLHALTRELGRDRIDSELDVPVTLAFADCCPFAFVELD